MNTLSQNPALEWRSGTLRRSLSEGFSLRAAGLTRQDVLWNVGVVNLKDSQNHLRGYLKIVSTFQTNCE
jgi:hypothetical protein